jgi:hypothetical protein
VGPSGFLKTKAEAAVACDKAKGSIMKCWPRNLSMGSIWKDTKLRKKPNLAGKCDGVTV